MNEKDLNHWHDYNTKDKKVTKNLLVRKSLIILIFIKELGN